MSGEVARKLLAVGLVSLADRLLDFASAVIPKHLVLVVDAKTKKIHFVEKMKMPAVVVHGLEAKRRAAPPSLN